MSFLLLDECVAKCCVEGGVYYTAQRSVEVRGLGHEAEDQQIYNFVSCAGCILVTLNGRDFAALAVSRGPIPAVILPPVTPQLQHAYLRWVMPKARATFAADKRRFVEVLPQGRAISYIVQRGFSWEHRPHRPSDRPRPPTH